MSDPTADPASIAATAAHDALSFRELLAYTGEETARWEEWLRAQDPAVLAVPLGEGQWKTVGALIFHLFVVERRYTERRPEPQRAPKAERHPKHDREQVTSEHRSLRGRASCLAPL